MPVYNLIEYSDNYSKTSEILWQYCRDVPAANDDGIITDFTGCNATTDLFSLKEKLTGQTSNNAKKNVETIATLKYPSNFWRSLEMPLISCKIVLDLNWSKTAL